MDIESTRIFISIALIVTIAIVGVFIQIHLDEINKKLDMLVKQGEKDEKKQ